MKRKMSGSANGRNTSFAGATPKTTHAAAPSSAVTASGRASVNQSTITAATITTRFCASGVRSMHAARRQRTEMRGQDTEARGASREGR